MTKLCKYIIINHGKSCEEKVLLYQLATGRWWWQVSQKSTLSKYREKDMEVIALEARDKHIPKALGGKEGRDWRLERRPAGLELGRRTQRSWLSRDHMGPHSEIPEVS